MVRALMVGCALALLGTAWSSANGQEAPPRPASLARYFPGQDLGVYFEFDGLDAHADRWKNSAAYRMLNETSTGAMLKELAAQLADRALASSDGKTLKGSELVLLVEHAFRSGFALGVNRPAGQPKPSSIGLVIRAGARGKVREILGRLIDAGNGPNAKIEAVSRPGGRRILVVGNGRNPSFAWWSEGDDLALNFMALPGADAMVEALDGRRPNAVEDPARVALARSEHGFEPVGLAFFDMAALPALPPQAASLGFDRIKRIDYRWGFQGESLMTVARLVAPSPRAGVIALFDQPALKAEKLPPLPEGLDGFTVVSIAPRTLFDQLAALFRATSPRGERSIAELEQAVSQATGRRLREDILAHLGPTMTYYEIPTRVNAPTNPIAGLAQGFTNVPKTCLVIEVDDAAAFAPILDDVMKGLAASLQGPARRDGKGKEPGVEIKPLTGPQKGFVVSIPPGVAMLPAGLRPTVLLGKQSLILAATPDLARQAVAREGRAGGLPAGDPLARTLGPLSEGLTVLSVSDTRSSLLPGVIANLPRLAQLIGSGGIRGLPGPPRILGGPAAVFRRPPGGPQANGFQVRIDPDEIPSPDELRPFLFPARYALSVDDQAIEFVSRESFPGLNPLTLAPVAFAMVLPAVQASRTAARRAQSVNNLKQIGLALHNYHSVNDHFPPVAIRDKSGKPLLSWRVAILPFIEQQGLFQEFKQDEPWDSPHNKALLERMPIIYAVPGAPSEPGKTFYQGFRGPGTIFDPSSKNGVGIREITDGTSNTLAVVEAHEAVPWTKPDGDVPFDGAPPTKLESLRTLPTMLGNHFPGGFNALFADGSVRFLKTSINLVVLRALITRNGGEVISADSF
jgi:prepilin-type processing-associated H-X9-DG protein